MSVRVHVAAVASCSWRLGTGPTEGKGDAKKGTEWVSSVVSSPLQLELEGAGAPFARIAVEHGAFCEGHVPFGVYQDYCIGPGWEDKQRWSEITEGDSLKSD